MLHASRRHPQQRILYYPTICNNSTTDAQTCDTEATVATLYLECRNNEANRYWKNMQLLMQFFVDCETTKCRMQETLI